MITQIIDIALHLDSYVAQWASLMGPWLYVLMFLIVFAETGLVVTPFLPGDSLLFALGAVCVLPDSGLNVFVMGAVLFVAALSGDNVNYFVGRKLGPKVFSKEQSFLFNKNHLIRTQAFYDSHGGKTIIMARFMPIVRTFAPFVAGIGRMPYSRYISFSVGGAILWITSFLYMGYTFGNLPSVKRNFHYVILGVIVLSVMPIVIGWIKARKVKVD